MTARLHSVPETELPGVRAQPDVPEDFYTDPELDLDQSWDVLTQVLFDAADAGADAADDDAPLAYQAILGGTPFGEDQGFGPPRTFGAGQVAAIAAQLQAIGEARFRALFGTADCTDCYSADNYDVDEALAAFRALRDCYREAAAAGRAMVLFM